MLWTKTFHILFVTSWFAGLFYLPRIYVNLAQSQNADTTMVLQGMAHRLYRFMFPLAILSLVSGLALFLYYGVGVGRGWIHAKLVLVAALVLYHWWCGRILQQFKNNRNTRSHTYYRWFNEIPVLLLLLVLILVVLKPF
ncbi:CopD family protein [Paenalcaligenes niemegkensis]|uniref:CopD family protein n=1 Tax=Paenalcaligenes niemegkensis TaxID=2895469 RepID=UPI001EE8F99F|nr:CopD family protein [Paenalcaligenes niemegkensis]MCQ9616853.1 CopD family protein [Paenalcaligenes niemegkensis]